MGRIHLFELEDQHWLPRSIRDAGTDYLRFILEAGDVYRAIVPLPKRALVDTTSTEILDLCSGGGGPMLGVRQRLADAGYPVSVTLTDKYPNSASFEYAKQTSGGVMDFIDRPVDAATVSPELGGFRTLFNSLHHFRPQMAHGILQDACQQHRPIGVFDLAPKKPPPLSIPLLGNPLGVWALTPLVRPFRWSRLFWTYVLPVVPPFLLWDGLVSGLRLYSVEELEGLVEDLQSKDYQWEVGQVGRFPSAAINYVLGCPK